MCSYIAKMHCKLSLGKNAQKWWEPTSQEGLVGSALCWKTGLDGIQLVLGVARGQVRGSLHQPRRHVPLLDGELDLVVNAMAAFFMLTITFKKIWFGKFHLFNNIGNTVDAKPPPQKKVPIPSCLNGPNALVSSIRQMDRANNQVKVWNRQMRGRWESGVRFFRGIRGNIQSKPSETTHSIQWGGFHPKKKKT